MARFFKPQKRKTDTKHKEITISRLDHLGAGIGHLNNKLVFVEGLLPGETAIVQLTEDKKNYARARTIKRLTASQQRIKPHCAVYDQCGGCNLQHLSHEGQVIAKQQSLDELMSKFGVSTMHQVAPITGKSELYRRRARFSLKLAANGQLLFGFRKKQSNDIVDVSNCPVLSQSLNELLIPLREMLFGLKGRSHLGHVELVNADNGRVLLIRHLQPFNEADRARILHFANEHQLMLFLAPSADELQHCHGEQPYYEIEGVKLTFSPKDFIQVNSDINKKMVAQTIDWLDVQPQDRILDLFCGLGNFSLPLAKRAKALVGVEGVDDMVVRATQNAFDNQITNAKFYQANLDEDVTKLVWAKERFDKILLDPARAGAAGVMQHVVNLSPDKVVYVSCNPATLARDSQVLLQQGYQLERLGMLDMFPHTGHLESMALFVKKS